MWSAGCSSGQEAYTIAIVLAELLGVDAYRERVKIYATDVDEDALAQARSASYDAKAVESVPPALLEKYFEIARWAAQRGYGLNVVRALMDDVEIVRRNSGTSVIMRLAT